MKIGIVLVATNSYLVLGIRFIKRFMQFYKGNEEIVFHIFTDENPLEYLPEGINVKYHHTTHSSWVDATNSKFTSILSLEGNDDCTHYFYFDADTNINKDFTEQWFIADSVAGQHYADQSWMKEKKGFERNPRSKAYVPIDTPLFQVYTYGAFWGGSSEWIMNFCRTMIEWQKADKSWGFEPGVNDESFSNAYFHYNPPEKLVLTSEFAFAISDKGGFEGMRNPSLNVLRIKKDLKLYKNENINIQSGLVIPHEK